MDLEKKNIINFKNEGGIYKNDIFKVLKQVLLIICVTYL